MLAALLTAVNPIHCTPPPDTCVDASSAPFFCLTCAIGALVQAPTVANCAWRACLPDWPPVAKQPALVLSGHVLAHALATRDAAWQMSRWQGRFLVSVVLSFLSLSAASLLAFHRDLASDLNRRFSWPAWISYGCRAAELANNVLLPCFLNGE